MDVICKRKLVNILCSISYGPKARLLHTVSKSGYMVLDFKNHLKAGEAAVTYLKCLNGISCTHDKNLSIWQDLKICEYLFGQTNCHNPFVINYCLSDLTCLCCTKGLTTLANI